MWKDYRNTSIRKTTPDQGNSEPIIIDKGNFKTIYDKIQEHNRLYKTYLAQA